MVVCCVNSVVNFRSFRVWLWAGLWRFVVLFGMLCFGVLTMVRLDESLWLDVYWLWTYLAVGWVWVVSAGGALVWVDWMGRFIGVLLW